METHNAFVTLISTFPIYSRNIIRIFRVAGHMTYRFVCLYTTSMQKCSHSVGKCVLLLKISVHQFSLIFRMAIELVCVTLDLRIIYAKCYLNLKDPIKNSLAAIITQRLYCKTNCFVYSCKWTIKSINNLFYHFGINFNDLYQFKCISNRVML